MVVPDEPLDRRIPFKHVYFTGIIRDAQGRKMSKSLGNSPDPLDLIDKYGADGLRFGIISIAPQGQDIRFQEDRIEGGKNFCNKLWNACRFRQMSGEAGDNSSLSAIMARLVPAPRRMVGRRVAPGRTVDGRDRHRHAVGAHVVRRLRGPRRRPALVTQATGTQARGAASVHIRHTAGTHGKGRAHRQGGQEDPTRPDIGGRRTSMAKKSKKSKKGKKGKK